MAEFNMQTIQGVKKALETGNITSEQLVKETASIFENDSNSSLPLNQSPSDGKVLGTYFFLF